MATAVENWARKEFSYCDSGFMGGGELVFPIEIHLQLIGIHVDDVMGVKHLTTKGVQKFRKLCNGPP